MPLRRHGGAGDMAAQPRYLRYILFAFLGLVVIFFISSSSTRSLGAEHLQSAAVALKSQNIWKGKGSQTPGAGSAFVQDSNAKVYENGPVVNPHVGPGNKETSPKPKAGTSNTISTSDTSPNPKTSSVQLPPKKASGARMNATFVTLARNSDIWDITRSIRQVEDRFNRDYNYDWVFLNDEEFDDSFVKITTALTSGKARYGKVSPAHWGFPDFIDQDKAQRVREDMHERKIIYGDSISYRHMCRYESGFFFRHPIMLEYEWYWRVEPSIELYCDIAYDPFKYMADHKKRYSFVVSLFEYVETIPTLWESVRKFMKQHPEHIAPQNSMDFLSDDGGATYTGCHFWSNFEIADLTWLRSKAYMDYFDFLDHEGGFFYERWGDAPIHSIAAALMLNKDEIHYFNDIAYYHIPFTHCPTGEQLRLDLKCSCNPKDNFDWNGYSCTKRWYEVNDWTLPEGYEEEQ